MMFLKCAKPAPPCCRIVGCCVLLCTPGGSIWDAITIERPHVGAESGGIQLGVCHRFHVSFMPLFEINSGSSIGFNNPSVCSSDTVPVYNIAVHTLVWHGTGGFVPAVAECCSPFDQFLI